MTTITISDEEFEGMNELGIDNWYYLSPFYYHRNKANTWEVYSDEDLPEPIKNIIYGK